MTAAAGSNGVGLDVEGGTRRKGGIEAVFGPDLAKKNVFRSTTLIILEKLFSSAQAFGSYYRSSPHWVWRSHLGFVLKHASTTDWAPQGPHVYQTSHNTGQEKEPCSSNTVQRGAKPRFESQANHERL
jgi:hypothetical protein